MKKTLWLAVCSAAFFTQCLSSKKAATLQKTCCQCITEQAEKPAALERTGDCMAQTYGKKARAFKTEKERNDFMMYLHGRLMRNCQAYAHLVHESAKEDQQYMTPTDTPGLSRAGAEDYNSFIDAPGKYYLEINGDTTRIQLASGYWTDSLQNGRYYSRCTFRKEGECGFLLTVVRGNHPVKSIVVQKGDDFHYRILERSVDHFLVEGQFNTQLYQFKIFYRQ